MLKTSAAVELPPYTRRVPDEWPSLLTVAEDITEGGTISPSQQGLNYMYDSIDALPNEELDANRYFGLGSMICQFAVLIKQPTIQAAIVNDIGLTIAQDSYHRYVSTASECAIYKGIRLLDLTCSLPATRARMELLALPLIATVEPSVNFVTNALTAVAKHRLFTAQRSGDLAGEMLMRFRMGQPLAARSITHDVLGGATGVYSRAIDAKAHADPSKPNIFNPVIADVLDAAQLRELDLLSAAMNTTRLHVDEFTDFSLIKLLLENNVENNGTNSLVFRRDLLPKQVASKDVSDPEARSIHRGRLACPALQVGGAISQVIDLVPEIIIRAQQFSAEWLAEPA